MNHRCPLLLSLFLWLNFSCSVSAALFNPVPIFNLAQPLCKAGNDPLRTRRLHLNSRSNGCYVHDDSADTDLSPRPRQESFISQNTSRSALHLSGGESNVAHNTEKNPTKKVIVSILLMSISAVVFMNRGSISAFDFKGFLAEKLDLLASFGTPGLICYTFGFMVWEILVGVTTPVETAAGMAFGLKKALFANAIGKTSGAVCAFLLGRFILNDYVSQKLDGNEYLDLVKYSIVKNPIKVALIWRFSFLPEQVKNFGLAVLPLKTWQFVTAVLMHGFPFTCLWSFLGNEMGLVVRGVVSEPSRILKVLMSGVYVFGFFISPALVGAWVKGLRDEKVKRENK